MIDYADKDRDGGISYEEFVATVTRQYPKVWFSCSCAINYHLLLPKYQIYIYIFIKIYPQTDS